MLEPNKQFLKLAHTFSAWLDAESKKIVYKIVNKDEDWIVKQENDGSIIFNTYILKKCPVIYYGTILVHELVHVFFQGVPNKGDVTHLKEGFGETSLRILDIQADLYTARFYHEYLGLSYKEFVNLLYAGQSVFKEDKIRKGKFERFLGTHLTLYQYFKEGPHDLQFLIVPEIGNYALDGQIKLLETGSKLYRYATLSVPRDIFESTVYLYERGHECDSDTYFTLIRHMCSRFYGTFMLAGKNG